MAKLFSKKDKENNKSQSISDIKSMIESRRGEMQAQPNINSRETELGRKLKSGGKVKISELANYRKDMSSSIKEQGSSYEDKLAGEPLGGANATNLTQLMNLVQRRHIYEPAREEAGLTEELARAKYSNIQTSILKGNGLANTLTTGGFVGLGRFKYEQLMRSYNAGNNVDLSLIIEEAGVVKESDYEAARTDLTEDKLTKQEISQKYFLGGDTITKMIKSLQDIPYETATGQNELVVMTDKSYDQLFESIKKGQDYDKVVQLLNKDYFNSQASQEGAIDTKTDNKKDFETKSFIDEAVQNGNGKFKTSSMKGIISRMKGEGDGTSGGGNLLGSLTGEGGGFQKIGNLLSGFLNSDMFPIVTGGAVALLTGMMGGGSFFDGATDQISGFTGMVDWKSGVGSNLHASNSSTTTTTQTIDLSQFKNSGVSLGGIVSNNNNNLISTNFSHISGLDSSNLLSAKSYFLNNGDTVTGNKNVALYEAGWAVSTNLSYDKRASLAAQGSVCSWSTAAKKALGLYPGTTTNPAIVEAAGAFAGAMGAKAMSGIGNWASNKGGTWAKLAGGLGSVSGAVGGTSGGVDIVGNILGMYNSYKSGSNKSNQILYGVQQANSFATWKAQNPSSKITESEYNNIKKGVLQGTSGTASFADYEKSLGKGVKSTTSASEFDLIKNTILGNTYAYANGVGTAAYQLGGVAQDGSSVVSGNSFISQGDLGNVTPTMTDYLINLAQGYNLVDMEMVNDLAGMYNYYKLSTLNSIATGGGGLGSELSDAFFGDISKWTTDGIRSISEGLTQDITGITEKARGMIDDGFNWVNNFTDRVEELTGVSIKINPELQNMVNDTMEKLGLGSIGSAGQGANQVRARVQGAVGFRNRVKFVEKNVEVEHDRVVELFDKHDFLNKLGAEMYLTLSLSDIEIKNLGLLDDIKKEYDIEVYRTYGHTQGQNPSNGASIAGYNTEQYDYEKRINLKVRRITKIQKSEKAIKSNVQKKSNHTANEKQITFSTVKFIILDKSLELLDNNAKINGVPKDCTFEEFIAFCAKKCYKEGMQVFFPELPPDKKDTQMENIPIAPAMGFHDVIKWLQKQYKLWGQEGVNIYNSQAGLYIVPKSGNFESIQGNESWTFEFTVAEDTNTNKDMYTKIYYGQRKIMFCLFESEIEFPGSVKDLAPTTGNTTTTGKVGAKDAVNEKSIATKTETQQHDYVSNVAPKKVDNQVVNIKMDHCFFGFLPSDIIKIHYHGEIYKGSITRWVSQNKGPFRKVALQAVVDSYEKTWEDDWSPGNLIEKGQTFLAELESKTENFLWKTADVVGKKMDDMFKWVSNKEGNGFFDKLQEYIPGLGNLPGFDIQGNINGTYMGDVAQRLGIELPETMTPGNAGQNDRKNGTNTRYILTDKGLRTYEQYLQEYQVQNDFISQQNGIQIPDGAMTTLNKPVKINSTIMEITNKLNAAGVKTNIIY